MAGNHAYRLAARPVGLPKDSDWAFAEEPIPEPGEGEVLVKIDYISLDPAMRGWMNESRSYIRPVELGDVMRAGTVGEIVASRHQSFAAGEHVAGAQGVQEYGISDGRDLFKVDPRVAPLQVWSLLWFDAP